MTKSTKAAWIALFTALTLSGVAGLVNQVVWQRALKIFLGGSETLSSMVVVLVFLGGLGLGAAAASRWSSRVYKPLVALAGVELTLALVNLIVAALLGLDISESVYAAQRLAVSFGLPLRFVYGVGSAALLLVPTMLMGATVPLASESAQRQLGSKEEALVPILFFVNTAGAALGALGASTYLLPYFGQRATLSVAVLCNGLAALLLYTLCKGVPGVAAASDERRTPRPPRWLEGMGFALGFLSLGYEMVLFRVLSLAHEPLPQTFAVGLFGFLAAWSVGVMLTRWVKMPPFILSVFVSVLMMALPWFYTLDRFGDGFELLGVGALYFLPCVGFGLLYGLYVQQAAGDWGRDVGRYTALNTIGSCLGILLFTLVGHEMPLTYVSAILASLLVVAAGFDVVLRRPQPGMLWGVPLAGTVLALSLTVVGWSIEYEQTDEERTYWGRDGVIEVGYDDNVYIDGLWHTKLTDGVDHIGRPYSWVMAVAGVMAHEDVPLKNALVIGAGVGISSVTLAGVDGLEVDGYEINHTLKRVLRDYPDKTLDALNRDTVHWSWRDARTGLALNNKRYDIILSAPLHLRQAGSSLLLSVEYLRLAKSRLADGGVLVVYSNEGVDAQNWLVRRTLMEVFDYQASWYDGTVTVASDSPILLSKAQLSSRMKRKDRLYREMWAMDKSLDEGLYSWYDGAQISPVVADRLITDDHPLVEYPEVATELVHPVSVDSVKRR